MCTEVITSDDGVQEENTAFLSTLPSPLGEKASLTAKVKLALSPRIQLTVKVVEIAIHTYSWTVSFRKEHKKQLQGSTWEESVWYDEKAVPQHRLGSACLHEGQGFPLSVYLPWTWNVCLGLVSYCVLQRTNGVLPSDREAMWSKSRPYKIHEQRTRPTSSASHNWSSLADPNDEKKK